MIKPGGIVMIGRTQGRGMAACVRRLIPPGPETIHTIGGHGLRAITNQIAKSFVNCLTSLEPRPLIDLELARDQHREYCGWLEAQGVEVIRLEVNQDCPDGVFVEDTAVVTDELAVITTMGAAQRAAEPEAIARELANHRPLARLKPPASLEGGDVLRVGKRLWVGLTLRSNQAGVEALAAALSPHGYSVAGVKVRDCLHLKSAVSALDPETVLINPAMTDPEIFADYRRILVHQDEPFAGNALSLGRAVLCNAAYPRTAELIAAQGFEVTTIGISEFMKADAALTCPSIIFS